MRALVTAALLGLVLHVAPAHAEPTPITASTIPAWAASKHWNPCANDEGGIMGMRCVWDARHSGDGRGQSFIRTRTGRTLPITHRVAHWLLLPAYAARS